MKILLINANRFKHPWPVIPFGLSCVAAALESKGYELQVLDLCFSKDCAKDLKRQVLLFQPMIIGLSIRNIDNSAGYNTLFLLEATKNEIIKPLKSLFAGPIVIGGPSVGINGAEMLSYLDLNYAIRGDGEDAIVEFVRRIDTDTPLEGLEGLVIRKDEKIIQDNPPLLVKDLNTLPYVNPGKYIDLTQYRKYNSPLQIQTKRGCALECSYCTYNRIEGLKYRLRDAQKVADQIEKLYIDTGISHLEFTDSTFNIPLAHCKKVLKALKKKNLKLNLRTMGLNPGSVDEELVDLMKQNGFRDVDLGAEAGCDEMLKSLGKNYSKKEVIHAGKLLQEKGIPVTWYLLVGAPGETKETLIETFNTINQAASKWDLINIGVGLRVYKGSPIAIGMKNDNPSCTKDEFLKPVAFIPEALSLEQVKRITKQFALKNPNYFMFDEDETTPLFVLRLGTLILKIFAPDQPVWRLHILIRMIQKVTGIGLLKRMLYHLFERS
ncbi:MAG: radical SAM protein [Proteobacteria bacterium]|nr:radical SAM protein [Pseudomonadota bacterium]MBU1584308.1 radical SAM protein [Pseudomonadota bacterium]MBU2628855.1 radical SAM protein [Pseudomonadota bacterium]